MGMGWYRPRELLEIKFGGEKQPGDLPKPTEPLFSIVQGQIRDEDAHHFYKTLEEYSHHDPFESRIVSSKLLTHGDAIKPVYAVQLDVSSLKDWEFMPGDAFGILPENDSEVVQFALQRLGIDPQTVLQLSVIGKPTRESRTYIKRCYILTLFSGRVLVSSQRHWHYSREPVQVLHRLDLFPKESLSGSTSRVL